MHRLARATITADSPCLRLSQLGTDCRVESPDAGQKKSSNGVQSPRLLDVMRFKDRPH